MRLLAVTGIFEAPLVDCSSTARSTLSPSGQNQRQLDVMHLCRSRLSIFGGPRSFCLRRQLSAALLKGQETFSPQVAGPTSQGEALRSLPGLAIFVSPVLPECLWVDRHLEICCVTFRPPFRQTRRRVLRVGRPSARWAIRVSAASRFASSSEVAEGKRSHAHTRHADLDVRRVFTISLFKARQGLER